MRTSAFLMAAAGTAAIASTASASVIFTAVITAEDTDSHVVVGSQTWQFTVPEGSKEASAGWGSYQFGPNHELPGENPSALSWGSGNDFAMIHGVGVSFKEDPQVALNFNVSAGFSNMTFTIDSSIVSFGSIPLATGWASAFIGLTDSSFIGTPGAMVLAGLQGGNEAYAARYNPSVTNFTTLVAGGAFAGAPGFSQAISDNLGSAGSPVPVGATVSEIRSQFKFSLTPGDRASGTSTFEILPAPGASALFGLAGLLVARRRR